MANPLFDQIEQKFGLPGGLLDAVWSQESARGKYMLSPAGAQGHFQFMPATAKQYGLSDPNNLEQSANAAGRMFSDLLKKYNGDIPKTLAGYNWGQGNVDKYGLDKAPKETVNYINKIAPQIMANAVNNVKGRDLSAELFGSQDQQPQQQGRDLSAELFGSQEPAKKSMTAGQVGGDLLAGITRGAGSIGATILTPFDYAAKALGIENSFIGRTDRRAQMDAGLESMGANPDSLAYKGGKLASEIAGTAGVPGLLGKAALAVPAIAAKAPLLASSLASAGTNLGGTTGLLGKDLAVRALGGAASGAASAGLINPEDAKSGAIFGAATPVALFGAGKLGQYIGEKAAANLADEISRFNSKGQINKAIQESIDAGYTLPPSTVKPTFFNRVVESIPGKQATEQLASIKNNDVTERLVKNALGVADDAPLSNSLLNDLRKQAGTAYSDVAALSPQAAADLEALKTARNEASTWFKAYNRSARPDDLAKAKEFRTLAQNLEESLVQAANDANRKDLIPALIDARKQIAKTYTVERALNDAAGTVDARILGRMKNKGLPLSDGLDTVGTFGAAFRNVAKTPDQIGSPAVHNLKAMLSMAMSGGGAMAAGPAGLLAGAAPFVAPEVAKKVIFSRAMQNSLIPTSPVAGRSAELAKLLQNAELQQMLSRTAPVIASQRQ